MAYQRDCGYFQCFKAFVWMLIYIYIYAYTYGTPPWNSLQTLHVQHIGEVPYPHLH